MRSKFLGWVAGVVGLALLASCGSSTSPYGGGGGGGGGGTGGHLTSITVGNNTFRPTPDTVPAGQVTFSWSTSPPSNGHTVTWDSGPRTLPTDTGIMTSGSYSPTLQVGTYHYHCSVHAGMTGTIVVQ